MGASKYKFILPLVFYLLLVYYAYVEGPEHLSTNVYIPKLLANLEHYEGRHISIANSPVKDVYDDYFVLKDWGGENEVRVLYSDDLKQGDVVKVHGYCFLDSRGHVEADEVVLKPNYWWKVYLAPLALVILGYHIIKEEIWGSSIIGL